MASPTGFSINVNDPSLISLVNKLQDVFSTVGVHNPIDLPQISVVGSQSSGKSSVLENIVGRDFLPRGSGIVTRRPLVLQLINKPAANTTNGSEGVDNTSDGQANVNEYGEFLHIPGEKFYDFNKIRDEIVRETETKVGRNAGISPIPINLRIYSPNVLTLTLVDLPGLTKVPVGDQPKDIERQIREMVLKYIGKPNAIILAVTAANQDLANSDGLKLAREVDPEGQRTIGVLSKVDLMDEGTDVVDILAGRIIPLRLGYVPVVNRGQRDIENKRPISSALESEKNFFEGHRAYRNKASYCGTPYLARKLNLILMMHIKQTLPDIKARISSSLQKYSSELSQLGDSMLGNSANIILNIITEFSNEYRTVLEGNNQELSSIELSGGARISFVYHELYSNGVKAVDPFDVVKDIDIRTILYNSSGSSPALFVGTTAFELIVKHQIRRLEDPSLKCVSLVYDELVRILGNLLNKQLFRRYPMLKEKFHAVVISFFKKCMEPTNKLVRDLINMEACYINTGHPDFLNGHRAMAIVNERQAASKPTQVDPKTGKPLPTARSNSPSLDTTGEASGGSGFFGSFWASKNKKKAAAMEAPPPTLKASTTLSERESTEVEVIKLLITSYYNIVKRTMIDMVPKAIMYTLVQFTKDEMQRELLENMYRTNELDELLKESDYTVRRRKECQQMVESLSRASEIVSQSEEKGHAESEPHKEHGEESILDTKNDGRVPVKNNDSEYRATDFVNEESVQYQTALKVAPTESWHSKKGERIRDLAFIQVKKPFSENIKPFKYRDTPGSLKRGDLEVVGYPGDLPDSDDKGSLMYQCRRITEYNLETTKEHMIEYRIDTYGGQSGAPILSYDGKEVTAIGTHCYGAGASAGDRNSGNPIGGRYGNNYDDFKGVFKVDSQGIPIPLSSKVLQAKIVNPLTRTDNEESFWGVFNKVAKIGSVALPFAGSFLGPIGTLVGTAAGGVLGALGSEESFEDRSDKIQDEAADRALRAEAALQSVIRLGRSEESEEVFTAMRESWKNNHINGVGHLSLLLHPMLMGCALHVTIEKWKSRADPDPSSMKLHPKSAIKFEKEKEKEENTGGSDKSNKAEFIDELLGKTRVIEDPEESIEEREESIKQWLGPLRQKAIAAAKPLAAEAAKKALDKIIKKLESGGAESFVEDPLAQDGTAELLERAMLADCALQAIETLPKDKIEKLKLSPNDAGEEEGLIDAIKTRAQKIGPKAFKHSKQAFRRHLPVLLREIRKLLEQNSATTTSISAGNINWSNDDNPDAPVPEPEPPASPTPGNPDAPPKQPEPPASSVAK